MTELKPCPFCGGDAEIKDGVIYGNYVECTSCDASIGFTVGACTEVNGDFDGYGDALRAWNTRTPPRVKPLAWDACTAGDAEWLECDLGRYAVGIYEDQWVTVRSDIVDNEICNTRLAVSDTEAEAKAAAQADYEARILASLE